jgi:hypothetical protein
MERCVNMRLATIVYVSNAPQGLPTIFPQDLGAVRPDIEDLEFHYDSNTQELRITITLANGNAPTGEVVESKYDDIVGALVDHVSFELGFPLDSPRVVSYIEPSGSTTFFATPAIVGGIVRGFPVTDQEGFRRRLSALLPTSYLLQEYNAAAHVLNPVNQFVAFWGLLTHITGTGGVMSNDKYLHDQGIPYEPTPGHWGPETKFGRVRNEIGHPSDRGVKLSDLPMHASEVLPELKSIVRREIAYKIGIGIGITGG